jgi:putative cell wall-binding protein
MIPATRSTRRLGALLGAFVLLVTIAGPAAAVDGAAYVAGANAKRASVGKAPVSLSAEVDRITVERADRMARDDVFAHDMAYVESRLRALGVCFTRYGEIIAWESGYPTYQVSRTIDQWWRSPAHHDILIGDYNAAGGSHARSSRSGKTYSVMVFVKLCTPPPPSVAIQRLAGPDRYATAAAISRARFGGGASTVFVATGAGFPDALAGAPAAAKARGPILLAARDTLPTSTATELARLAPSRIVVLGGPASISDRVFADLKRYAASVVRWAGSDRYATAATISRSSFAAGVGVAYVATGATFPDALSGGAVAGKVGGPILLVGSTNLPASTANELARLKPGRIVILGGASGVSDGVARSLGAYATSGSVTRLAGADRFSTSVQVSRSAYGAAGSDFAAVATGTNFPDGLAGGPMAALLPGPLLLVSPTSLPSSVAAELARLDPEKVFVLGGQASVSDAVVNRIRAAVP